MNPLDSQVVESSSCEEAHWTQKKRKNTAHCANSLKNNNAHLSSSCLFVYARNKVRTELKKKKRKNTDRKIKHTFHKHTHTHITAGRHCVIFFSFFLIKCAQKKKCWYMHINIWKYLKQHTVEVTEFPQQLQLEQTVLTSKWLMNKKSKTGVQKQGWGKDGSVCDQLLIQEQQWN